MTGRPPTTAPLLLHLNGPPGVGKSTLARRWADDHPGTLLLDVDVLRTWVSGWRADFVGVGNVVWPVTLSVLSACATQGIDVVLPQLLADPEALARVERAALAGGAQVVEVFLEADPAELTARYAARPIDQPHLEVVHDLVANAEPDHLDRYVTSLTELASNRPDAIRLPTQGTLEETYARLRAAVE